MLSIILSLNGIFDVYNRGNPDFFTWNDKEHRKQYVATEINY